MDIIDSVELKETYPTVLERYFIKKYCLNLKNKSIDDHQIMVHSNRICLLTLGEHHPIIKNNFKIKRFNFQVSKNLNRLNNKVSGKGKKGGQILEPNSLICEIVCDNGTTYSIFSCIKGRLVEINEELINNPNDLCRKKETYIAIILPKLDNFDNLFDGLLNQNDYFLKNNL